jgi:membrane associated rhomboid family serine protease
MNGRLSFGVPRVTPLVRSMLATLFACFVLELVAQNWVGVAVFEALVLPTAHLSPELGWRLWTYVLVLPPHPQSVSTLLLDLLFLWLLVAPFEERFGAKRTLQLSVLATLGAGCAGLAAGLVSSNMEVLYGSQPVALAALSGFALSFRGQRLSVFGFGAFKPVHLVWFAVGYSTLIFLASRNVVLFASSLGAIGVGAAFARWITRPRRSSRAKMWLVHDADGKPKPTGKWLNRASLRYTPSRG